MTIQEFMAESIEKRLASVFRLARTVPEEKLDWTPGGEARTVLDQLQEIAIIPRLHTRILNERQMPEFDATSYQQYNEDRRKLKTIDECESTAQQYTALFVETIRQFPNEDLERRVLLPFNGGLDLSMAEVMQLAYWNLCYHEGQIQFVLNLLATSAP
jgi:uncharacterized damage-inducible protein DinB